jgi:hypothetical protein
VTAIERDLTILTREEIEAVIQYDLNHRAEIERAMQRSRERYETQTPKQEAAAKYGGSDVRKRILLRRPIIYEFDQDPFCTAFLSSSSVLIRW